ncbi:MAG: hypothetical protein MASP_01528 [Candidatus Methanolliviera sp. GoM_asphalt]|nr:MAG: hypothetical protein MASP_01528 [Candidatus Methanolliviera sp. GoM_asphalt]
MGYVQSNTFCRHCGIRDCEYKQQFEGLEKEHGIGIVRQMSRSERIRNEIEGRNIIIDDASFVQILRSELPITKEEMGEAKARCAEYVEWMTDSPVAEEIGKEYLKIFDGRQKTLNGETLCPKIKGRGAGEEAVKHDKERLKECIEAIDTDIIQELKKGEEGKPYHNLLHLAFDLVEGRARMEDYPEMGKGVEIIYFNNDLLEKAKKVVLATATPHPLDLLAFRLYYPECRVLSPNYEYNDKLVTVYQIFGRDGRYPLSSLMRNGKRRGLADTICKNITNLVKTKKLTGAKNEDFLAFGPGEFLSHLEIKKDGTCSFVDSLSGKNLKLEKAIDTAHYYGRENLGVGTFLDKKYLVGVGVMNPGRGYYSQISSFIKDLIFTTTYVHPFISGILDDIQDISDATWAQFEGRRSILQFIGRVRPWTENAIEKMIVIYGSIPLEPELHPMKMTFKDFEKLFRREKRGGIKHEILSIIRRVARGKSLKPIKLMDIARELGNKYNVPVSTVRRYIDKCIHLFCGVIRSSKRSGGRGRPNIVVFSRSVIQSLKNRGFTLLYFIRRGGRVLAQLSFGDGGMRG